MGNASSSPVLRKESKGVKPKGAEETLRAVIVTPDGVMDLETVLFGPQEAGNPPKTPDGGSKSSRRVALPLRLFEGRRSQTRSKCCRGFKFKLIAPRTSKKCESNAKGVPSKRTDCVSPEGSASPSKSPVPSHSLRSFGLSRLSEASTTSGSSTKTVDTGFFSGLSYFPRSSRRSSESSTASRSSTRSTDTRTFSKLAFLSTSSRQSSKSSSSPSSHVVSTEQTSQRSLRLSAASLEPVVGLYLDLHPDTADRCQLLEIQNLLFKKWLHTFADEYNAPLGQAKLPLHPRPILLKFQYAVNHGRASSKDFARKILYAMAYAAEKFKPSFVAAGVPVEEIDHVGGILHLFSNASSMQGEGDELLVGGKTVSGSLQTITMHFRCQEWDAFGLEVGKLAWRLSMSSWLRGERRCMDGSLVAKSPTGQEV